MAPLMFCCLNSTAPRHVCATLLLRSADASTEVHAAAAAASSRGVAADAAKATASLISSGDAIAATTNTIAMTDRIANGTVPSPVSRSRAAGVGRGLSRRVGPLTCAMADRTSAVVVAAVVAATAALLGSDKLGSIYSSVFGGGAVYDDGDDDPGDDDDDDSLSGDDDPSALVAGLENRAGANKCFTNSVLQVSVMRAVRRCVV